MVKAAGAGRPDARSHGQAGMGRPRSGRTGSITEMQTHQDAEVVPFGLAGGIQANARRCASGLCSFRRPLTLWKA